MPDATSIRRRPACPGDTTAGLQPQVDAQLRLILPDRAGKLADEVRAYSAERMRSALSAGDLGAWILAHSHYALSTRPSNLRWIFELSDVESLSLQEYVVDHFGPAAKEAAAREAQIASGMYEELQRLSEREGHVRVALRTLENRGDYTYRALAIFPDGTQLCNDPLLDDTRVASGNGIVYMPAEVSCVELACREVHSTILDKGSVGYLRYIKPDELGEALGGGSVGRALEFFDIRTHRTRDPSAYLLAALMGYFENNSIYRIPPALLK